MEHVDGEDDEEDVEGADHAGPCRQQGDEQSRRPLRRDQAHAREQVGSARRSGLVIDRDRANAAGVPHERARAQREQAAEQEDDGDVREPEQDARAGARHDDAHAARPAFERIRCRQLLRRTHERGEQRRLRGPDGGTGGRGYGCSDIGCERDPGSHSGRGREQRGRLDRVAGYEHESRPAPVRRGRRERCDENGRDELHDGHDSRGRRTPTRKA